MSQSQTQTPAEVSLYKIKDARDQFVEIGDTWTVICPNCGDHRQCEGGEDVAVDRAKMNPNTKVVCNRCKYFAGV